MIRCNQRSWPRERLTHVLLSLGMTLVPFTAHAQAVPQSWAAKGIAAMPPPSPQLAIKTPSFVSSNSTFSVDIDSQLPALLSAVLYATPLSNSAQSQLIADFSVGSQTDPKWSFTLRLAESATLVLLAQTPSGWVRTERVVHVGKLVGK
jgi:hypothetical protein